MAVPLEQPCATHSANDMDGQTGPLLMNELFINFKRGRFMPHQGKSTQDYTNEYNWSHETSMKHWRAWGSWFSWGSPVGLGLFFISIAVTLWILSQAFGWN